MIKSYVFLYLLFSFYMITKTSCDTAEVVWDDSNDVIYFEGKLYFASDNKNALNPPKDEHTNNNVTQNSNSHSDKNLNDGVKDKLPEKFPVGHAAHEEELATGARFWFYVFMILLLTTGSGLFSGLTVGYLSIDDLVLELRSKNGTDEEKEYAEKVLPILAKRHWLLVSLLLMNAICMEALPLFLDKILPEFLAIVISVSLVLLFGEIIPQAYCTGPDQVKIAAFVSPLTKGLMWGTYPISYPISLLLDHLLGHHTKSRFINNDLKALIELHTYNALEKLHEHGPDPKSMQQSDKMGLNDEQANLMISALEMREKKVIELMIPIRNTFMIDYDDILDKFKLNLILDKGYSRIPVYSNHNKNDILGLLRIKQLIGVDFGQNKSLRQLGIELGKPIVINPRVSVIDLLREFRKGKSHMAFITEQVEDLQNKFGLNRSNSIQKDFSFLGIRSGADTELAFIRRNSNNNIKILGIVTLEDVIEKMINLEILDEDDYEKVIKKSRLHDKSNAGSYVGSKAERSRLLGKEIASSFIREESSQLESILNGSISNRKSIKDYYNKKGLKGDSDRDSISNNKDPLI